MHTSRIEFFLFCCYREEKTLPDYTVTRFSDFPWAEKEIHCWFDRWEEMLGGAKKHTVEILANLKKNNVPLFILSNWSAETFPKAQAIFDFLKWFDGKIISGEVGLIKPDPAIYRLLLNTYNLSPNNTIFIDDKIANVDAAKRMGIKGIHFQNAFSLRQNLKEMDLF